VDGASATSALMRMAPAMIVIGRRASPYRTGNRLIDVGRPQSRSIKVPMATRDHQIVQSTDGEAISAIPTIWTVRLRI